MNKAQTFKFHLGNRAGVFIWENFQLGYRYLGSKNRDFSNRQGRSEGGSWGARDPPFVSLFLSKQRTIFCGKNAMTIMFDTM